MSTNTPAVTKNVLLTDRTIQLRDYGSGLLSSSPGIANLPEPVTLPSAGASCHCWQSFLLQFFFNTALNNHTYKKKTKLNTNKGFRCSATINKTNSYYINVTWLVQHVKSKCLFATEFMKSQLYMQSKQTSGIFNVIHMCFDTCAILAVGVLVTSHLV